MKILLIDDDEYLSQAVAFTLEQHNYAVDVATDGEAGWELVKIYTYNLIVSDVMLPKLDGISLCQRLRSAGYNTPILLLTGCASGKDKVMGLDAGADDYLVKPFDIEELLARIRVLLRRGAAPLVLSLQWEKLRLDPGSCEVTYNGKLLHLTPKEYRLLELFLRNPSRVFSREDIINHLWSSDDPPGEATVTTHITGLRQKLKVAGSPPEVIETIYGLGYRLKALEAAK